MRGHEHEEHPNTQTTSFKGLRCAPDSQSAPPRREQVVVRERRDLNRAGVDTACYALQIADLSLPPGTPAGRGNHSHKSDENLPNCWTSLPYMDIPGNSGSFFGMNVNVHVEAS